VNHCFCATLQIHNSPIDCAKELFKPSKDSASLRVCNDKNIFGWVFVFFVGGVISGVGFGHFGQLYQPLDPNH